MPEHKGNFEQVLVVVIAGQKQFGLIFSDGVDPALQCLFFAALQIHFDITGNGAGSGAEPVDGGGGDGYTFQSGADMGGPSALVSEGDVSLLVPNGGFDCRYFRWVKGTGKELQFFVVFGIRLHRHNMAVAVVRGLQKFSDCVPVVSAQVVVGFPVRQLQKLQVLTPLCGVVEQVMQPAAELVVQHIRKDLSAEFVRQHGMGGLQFSGIMFQPCFIKGFFAVKSQVGGNSGVEFVQFPETVQNFRQFGSEADYQKKIPAQSGNDVAVIFNLDSPEHFPMTKAVAGKNAGHGYMLFLAKIYNFVCPVACSVNDYGLGTVSRLCNSPPDGQGFG